MPTITAAGYPDMEPTLLVEYAAVRPGRNIVHASIDPGSAGSYVSLAVAGLRTGALGLLFTNQDDAFTCFDTHALRLVFALHHELRHTMDMSYVVAGDMEIALDPVGARNWMLNIPFQEVSA